MVVLATGSAIWDKQSGVIRAAGIAVPGESTSPGSKSHVSFANNMGSIGELTTLSWKCTPQGYAYSGIKRTGTTSIGGGGTMFSCHHLYVEYSGLSMMYAHNFWETAKISDSPWPDDTYLQLSEVFPAWSIPDLADRPLEQISVNADSDIAVVSSYLNGKEINLFLIDGFDRIVKKNPGKTKTTDPTAVFSPAYTINGPIQVTGGRANPRGDPRDGNHGGLKIEYKTDNVTYFDGTTSERYGIYVNSSTSAWILLKEVTSSSKAVPWVGLDPPNSEEPPPASGFLTDLLGDGFFNTLVTVLAGGTLQSQYEEPWMREPTIKMTTEHSRNLASWSNPIDHRSPWVDSEVTKKTMGSTNSGGYGTSSPTYNPNQPLFQSAYYTEIVREINYDIHCEGSGSSGIPYLIIRDYELTTTKVYGYAVLNFGSAFWLSERIYTNEFATDPLGTPCWLQLGSVNIETFIRNLRTGEAIMSLNNPTPGGLTPTNPSTALLELAVAIGFILTLNNNILTYAYLSKLARTNYSDTVRAEWMKWLGKAHPSSFGALMQLHATASSFSQQQVSMAGALGRFKEEQPEGYTKLLKKISMIGDWEVDTVPMASALEWISKNGYVKPLNGAVRNTVRVYYSASGSYQRSTDGASGGASSQTSTSSKVDQRLVYLEPRSVSSSTGGGGVAGTRYVSSGLSDWKKLESLQREANKMVGEWWTQNEVTYTPPVPQGQKGTGLPSDPFGPIEQRSTRYIVKSDGSTEWHTSKLVKS